MAYPTPLDQVDPTSAEKAKLGANRIRDLAAAVRQRLNSIFNDPDGDPLTLRADTVGSAQIQAGAVGNAELAADAVTSDKIAALTIVNGDIADATIEVDKFSAALRTRLLDQTVYVAAYGALSPPLAVGTTTLILAFAPGQAGKTLVAWWSVLATADFTTDPIALGTTLQPFADGGKIGVVIRNHTGGALNPIGYSVSLAVLQEP